MCIVVPRCELKITIVMQSQFLTISEDALLEVVKQRIDQDGLELVGMLLRSTSEALQKRLSEALPEIPGPLSLVVVPGITSSPLRCSHVSSTFACWRAEFGARAS